MRRPKVPHVLLAGSDDVWKLRRAAAAFLRKLRDYLVISGPYHVSMGTDADNSVLGSMQAGGYTFRVRRIVDDSIVMLTVSRGQALPLISINLRHTQSWQFETLSGYSWS